MAKPLAMAAIMSFSLLLIGCPKDEPTGQTAQAAAETPSPAPAKEVAKPAAPTSAPAAAVMPTKLGDAAYPLTGLTWVKGEPVKITPGKVYVVEFWATWCPPCRMTIPHLTELQAKYKDRVTFVGISQEQPGVVKTFVSDQGDKMAYTVAVDVAGEVDKGYMRAFGQSGIPHAFVVDAAGKIVWHGHPMSPIEEVLDQVLDGTYAIAG